MPSLPVQLHPHTSEIPRWTHFQKVSRIPVIPCALLVPCPRTPLHPQLPAPTHTSRAHFGHLSGESSQNIHCIRSRLCSWKSSEAPHGIGVQIPTTACKALEIWPCPLSHLPLPQSHWPVLVYKGLPSAHSGRRTIALVAKLFSNFRRHLHHFLTDTFPAPPPVTLYMIRLLNQRELSYFISLPVFLVDCLLQ